MNLAVCTFRVVCSQGQICKTQAVCILDICSMGLLKSAVFPCRRAHTLCVLRFIAQNGQCTRKEKVEAGEWLTTWLLLSVVISAILGHAGIDGIMGSCKGMEPPENRTQRNKNLGRVDVKQTSACKGNHTAAVISGEVCTIKLFLHLLGY